MALNRFMVATLLLLLGFVCVSAFLSFESRSELEEGLVPCESNDDCSDLKNATCTEEGLCECNQAIFICEEITYPLTNIVGGRCKESKNCNVNQSVCSPQKKCVCKSGYVSSTNRRKCLKIAKKLGDPCEQNTQCNNGVKSSVCLNRKCTCMRGTHEHNGTCFNTVALGAPCSRDEECASRNSSSCVNSKCSCVETHVAINQQCLQIAEDVGDSCEEDVQCTATLGRHSRCSEGRCQCTYLYHYKTNTCVRDILLNQECREESDCHQPGQEQSRLMCVLGVCKCKLMFEEVDGYCKETRSAAGDTTRPEIFVLLLFVYFLVTVF